MMGMGWHGGRNVQATRLGITRFRCLSGGRDHGKQFAQPRCYQTLVAALAPMVDQMIRLALFFRNHDDSTFELSLSWLALSGPIILWASVSNYAISVAASSSLENDKPAAIMYFLDSGGGSMPQLIFKKQALWFTATTSEINPDVRDKVGVDTGGFWLRICVHSRGCDIIISCHFCIRETPKPGSESGIGS